MFSFIALMPTRLKLHNPATGTEILVIDAYKPINPNSDGESFCAKKELIQKFINETKIEENPKSKEFLITSDISILVFCRF
jgi:hypothetical protein